MPSFKLTAHIEGPYPREVWYAIGVIDGVSREFLDKPIVVTSLNDGTHMTGSLHYKNLAFDVRTRDLTPAEASTLLEKAKRMLDSQGYDTLAEGAGTPGSTGTHIHCEYQPKAGEIFVKVVD